MTARKRITIVGDIMLDEFVRGDVKRVSPEAPIPIIDVVDRTHALGGAANAAANVASLGHEAALIGVVGCDANAVSLAAMLTEREISSSLITDVRRPTTCKSRLIARRQQVVRVDHESREPLSGEPNRMLLRSLRSMSATSDAFIISDYAKGVVSREVMRDVLMMTRHRELYVIVDPKRPDLRFYAGCSIVTPNHAELERAVGGQISSDEDVVAACAHILPTLGGTAILATRGQRGMTLFMPGCDVFHVESTAKGVCDVTGAGDTVVAALAVALASGLPVKDAVVVANAAAGIAVSKPGTHAVSRSELEEICGFFGPQTYL